MEFMENMPTIKPPADNEKEKIRENETKENAEGFMKKLAGSRIGKTFMALGAAMAIYGTTEAAAQDYKVNPDALKNRIEELKQARAKNIITARNEVAKNIVQDCEFVENADGTFICKFTMNNVRIEARAEREGVKKNINRPASVDGPQKVSGPTLVPGPNSIPMSEWGK
jgi:hypothetical protein